MQARPTSWTKVNQETIPALWSERDVDPGRLVWCPNHSVTLPPERDVFVVTKLSVTAKYNDINRSF